MAKRAREDENECRPRFNRMINADLAHLIFVHIRHPLDIACCRLVCKDWSAFFQNHVKPKFADIWSEQNRWEQMSLLCHRTLYDDLYLGRALRDDSPIGVQYYLKHITNQGDLMMHVFDLFIEGDFAPNVARSILLPSMLSQPNDFIWRALYFVNDDNTIRFLVKELPASRLWSPMVFPGTTFHRRKLLNNMQVAAIPQDVTRGFMDILLNKHDMISCMVLYCFAQYTTEWPRGFCGRLSKSPYEPHKLLHWKMSEHRNCCF